MTTHDPVAARVPALARPVAGARPALLGALLAGLAVLLPGCIALSPGGLFPADRDQVFLLIFDNDTFYRDLQFQLTEGIKNEIISRPGLRLSSKEEAEVFLWGRIVSVRQRALSEDPERRITSESTTITVVIEITDARTGELIKTKTLTNRGEYVPDKGQSLEDAQLEAFKFLARDIVRELEVDF